MGDLIIDAFFYSVATMSLLSTTVVFVSYLSFSDLRTPIYRVVTYLALSDFIWILFVLCCHIDDRASSCSTYAYLITSCQLASVLWTVYIAYSVKVSIIRQSEKQPKFKWWFYPLIGFGIPLGLAALPFVTKSYNKKDLTWCWIARHDSLWANLWFLLLFYVPLFIGLTYCAYSYIKASKIMRANLSIMQMDNAELQSRLFYIRKLKFFPLILVVCWLPGFFLDFILFAVGEEFEYLDKASAILSCTQGLLNSLAYSYSSVLVTYVRNRFCPHSASGCHLKEDLVDELLGF